MKTPYPKICPLQIAAKLAAFGFLTVMYVYVEHGDTIEDAINSVLKDK